MLLLPPSAATLAEAITDDHTRALATGRMIAVASSSHHVVKPWFAGRVDVSPPAGDFAAQGFPLAGRPNADGSFGQAEPGVLEFACTSGALGKCVRFGYAPWGDDVAKSLDLYNACIRMTRADYCGDGTATTKDGQRIDIYDDGGVQRPENEPAMDFEAGWTAQGAACVRHVRVKENISLTALAAQCPRLAKRLGATCTHEGEGRDAPAQAAAGALRGG